MKVSCLLRPVQSSTFGYSDGKWWRQKKMASFERMLARKQNIYLNETYKLVRKIGGGSFGDIFLAVTTNLQVQVNTYHSDLEKLYLKDDLATVVDIFLSKMAFTVHSTLYSRHFSPFGTVSTVIQSNNSLKPDNMSQLYVI